MSIPEKEMSQFEKMFEDIAISARTDIDGIMTPIIAELIASDGNIEHPSFVVLFNWLVDPSRTGEDFLYIIGPLEQRVFEIMNEHFTQSVTDRHSYFRVAAEALAVKNPVLEGPWQLVGWVLVYRSNDFIKFRHGVASNYLSAWILNTIRYGERCHNAELRIEFLNLLKIVEINDQNRKQALESVLSACSLLTVDYLVKVDCGDLFNRIDLWSLIKILRLRITCEYLDTYDEELAEKLICVKDARLSAIIHDFPYYYAIRTSKYYEPIALYGLSALLRVIADYSSIYITNIQEEDVEWQNVSNVIIFIILGLELIILRFRYSCQSPQLSELTAHCILGVFELCICATDRFQIYENNRKTIERFKEHLNKLFGDDQVLLIRTYIGQHKRRKALQHLIWLLRR